MFQDLCSILQILGPLTSTQTHPQGRKIPVHQDVNYIVRAAADAVIDDEFTGRA